MANEFKHVSVGTEITQAEYEGTAGHVFNSQATGDIMYASSSSQLTRLGIGSTGAVLTVTGGVPAWDTTWTPTGHLIPATDDSYDLGSASAAWQDLFLEGDITLTDAGTIATSAGALTITSAAAATWSTSSGALTVTSGAALNLNPTAGSAIVLDGTINVDAGVVTGATSITSTAFAGDLTGDVTGTADTATVATGVTASANNSTDETVYPTFVDGATGTQGIETDTGFTYNPSSGLLTISGELDAGSLDISGNADIDGTLEADAITVDGTTLAEYIADTAGAMFTSNTETGITATYQDADNTIDLVVGTLNQDTTGTAAIATTVTITDNENTNENNAVIFTSGGDVDGGNIGLESDGDFTYNPSTGTVTATTFVGALTGNVTGNASGTAATVTGAAQSNITSLGTLTTLTVDNVITNGTTIGHTSDTDLLTLTSANLAVAGDIEVSGSVEVATIDFTDGDNALTIADGGGVTFPQASTFTGGFTANGDINLAAEKLVKIGGTAEAHDFSTEHSGHGITLTMEAGETLTLGQAVYVDSNGKAQHPDVDASGVTGKPAIGVAMTAASSGASVNVMVLGIFRDATYDFTPGSAVIMTGTDGALTTTAGDTAADGDIVQRIGIAITADMLFVMPSIDEIEHAG